MTVPSATRTVTEQTLRTALEIAVRALTVETCADLPPLLGDIARYVGADTASLSRIDLVGHHEQGLVWPASRISSPARTLAAYPSVAPSHPARAVLLTSVRERRPWALPIQLAEVVPTRSWRETPLCREVVPALTDQLCLPIAYRDTTVTALSLSRLGGRFSSDAQALLTIAAPHLRAAVARTRGTSTMGLRLSPTVGWAAVSFAVADDRRQPRARGSDGEAPSHEAGAARPDVSAREREVLDLVVDGLTDAAIARRLGIARATVSRHLHRVYTRHGLANRAVATRWWLERTSRR